MYGTKRLLHTVAPVLMLALTAGGLAGPAALAQEATPRAPADALFADDLGLPELAIGLTDEGYTDVPTETAAGRYLVTFANEATIDGGVDFVLLPDSRTVDDFAGLSEAIGEAEMAASPAAGEAGNPLAEFAWLYQTYVAGGGGAAPGQTVQVVVDLRPGEYAVWSDDLESSIPPAPMTVTGEMPTDLPEPEADAVVTQVGTAEGYAFEFAGDLAAGPQVLRIDNKSDQPHFTLLIGSPNPVTLEQAEMLMNFDFESGEEPPAGMPDPESFTFFTYAATQSAGSTQWFATNLEPGSYIVACFVPDPTKGGIPHAMEGMLSVIDVG